MLRAALAPGGCTSRSGFGSGDGTQCLGGGHRLVLLWPLLLQLLLPRGAAWLWPSARPRLPAAALLALAFVVHLGHEVFYAFELTDCSVLTLVRYNTVYSPKISFDLPDTLGSHDHGLRDARAIPSKVRRTCSSYGLVWVCSSPDFAGRYSLRLKV